MFCAKLGALHGFERRLLVGFVWHFLPRIAASQYRVLEPPRPACWLCLSAPAEFADRLCATGGAEVQNQQWNSCVSYC